MSENAEERALTLLISQLLRTGAHLPSIIKTIEKVDDNIIQVKNIFKVISDEIANIDVECGYKPQVIVLEHADEDEFAQFIKYRWSKDGNKLI